MWQVIIMSQVPSFRANGKETFEKCVFDSLASGESFSEMCVCAHVRKREGGIYK